MNKQEALNCLDEKQELLFSLSDFIWDHPETDYTETVSSAALKEALLKEGFTVRSGLADIPTAFCGSFGSGFPVIGILGEFDALSGLSQKAGSVVKEALEKGGNGHGCGHNLLGTGSLAAVNYSAAGTSQEVIDMIINLKIIYPVALLLITIIILKFYPITPQFGKQMREELKERRAKAAR